MSRAAKQSYLGRVISPARYHDGVNGSRPYLSFQLFVDRLAVKAEDKKERTSGKIFCSYSVQSENDPVATILCNIINNKTGEGGLNGHTYKSVEVWVEGSEKLTEVKALDASGKEVSGAYYKSLEYCIIQVLDKGLIQIVRAGTNGAESNSGSGQTYQGQANVAPSNNRSSAQAEQSNRKTYSVGDTVVSEGKTYKFNGGDSSSMSNWEEVLPVAKPAPQPTGQVQRSNGNPFKPKEGTPQSSIRSMLNEDGGEEDDSPSFGSGNRPLV